MNDPLRIPVLVGSVRRGRQSIRVARFASDRLRRAGGVQVHYLLQLLFLRLRAVPVAHMAVPHVARSFDAGGEPQEERYEKAFARFVDTLEWYARAIGTALDPE